MQRTKRSLLPILFLILIPKLADADQFAFLVGVKQYDKNELTDLKYTERDVNSLANVLYQQGFPAKNVVLLSQAKTVENRRWFPSAKNIRNEFDLLLTGLDREDTIIVAFSGHGVQFDGEKTNYFCPIDAKLTNRDTLISIDAIYKALDRSSAQSKLLLVDACRNDPQSALGKAARRIKLEDIRSRTPPVLEGGVVALYSCSASQQSVRRSQLEARHFLLLVD